MKVKFFVSEFTKNMFMMFCINIGFFAVN